MLVNNCAKVCSITSPQYKRMMPELMPELISELLASGDVATIIHFFDVRVFNAFAESNQSPCPAVTFRRHEAKHRAYEECVCEVEPGSFTPIVFCSGNMHGRSVTVTYRHLASLLSVKWNSPYPVIIGWLHCSLGFSLLRSALMCLRGSRSRAGSPGVPAAVDLAVRAEGHLVTKDVNFLTTSVGSCRYLFCWSEFSFFK